VFTLSKHDCPTSILPSSATAGHHTMDASLEQHVRGLLEAHAAAATKEATQKSSRALLQVTCDIIGGAVRMERQGKGTGEGNQALTEARGALAELLSNVSAGTDWSALRSD